MSTQFVILWSHCWWQVASSKKEFQLLASWSPTEDHQWRRKCLQECALCLHIEIRISTFMFSKVFCCRFILFSKAYLWIKNHLSDYPIALFTESNNLTYSLSQKCQSNSTIRWPRKERRTEEKERTVPTREGEWQWSEWDHASPLQPPMHQELSCSGSVQTPTSASTGRPDRAVQVPESAVEVSTTFS